MDLSQIDPTTFVRAGVAIVVLMAITGGILVAVGAPRPVAPLLAILRGIAQLAVVSVVLTGVITNPWWVALALLVMFCSAVLVVARRLGGWNRVGVAAVSMGAGAAVAIAVVFATGALDLSARYALALGGIVIGNTMSIATIGGRRLLEMVDDRWDEIEGWFALGASPRQSTRSIAREAIYSALIPTTDQTKTTGLVTLPGAFVGAIFGGVSPLEAGRFQIVVLAAIMCAGAITAAALVTFIRAIRTRPAHPR